MAIIQALLAAVARSTGKIVNTAFSWATIMLFGKVPEDRQIYLSGMAFGSVAWIIVVIGTVFPNVGVFLLSFAHIPKWVNPNWVRLAMLVATLFLPMAIGFLSLKLLDPEDAPKDGKGKVKMVFKGYPYTLGLAITLIMLTLFTPIMKVRTMAKRWVTEHVPILVEPQDYMGEVSAIQDALKDAGWETRREPASWMVRLPTKVLTSLTGGGIQNLVADQMTTLVSDQLEVVLHPSDLVVNGKKEEVAHVRATLAEQLAFSKAYLTWSKDANEFEDRLRDIWESARNQSDPARDGHALEELGEIEKEMKKKPIPYEEWESLNREKLLVERSLLQAAAGLTDHPQKAAEATTAQTAQRASETETPQPKSAPDRPVSKMSQWFAWGTLLLNFGLAGWGAMKQRGSGR